MSITHTSGSATPNDPAVLLLRSAELDLTLEIVQVSQPASTTATVDGKVVEVTPSSILALSHLCHAISLVHRLSRTRMLHIHTVLSTIASLLYPPSLPSNAYRTHARTHARLR